MVWSEKSVPSAAQQGSGTLSTQLRSLKTGTKEKGPLSQLPTARVTGEFLHTRHKGDSKKPGDRGPVPKTDGWGGHMEPAAGYCGIRSISIQCGNVKEGRAGSGMRY